MYFSKVHDCAILPFFSEIIPTIIGFKETYLQVSDISRAVSVCLQREINLYRKDTINVTLQQKEKTKLDTGLHSVISFSTHITILN